MYKYRQMAAGYSKTPLAKKLGIKAGAKMKLVNEPVHYYELFDDMPASVTRMNGSGGKKNFIHFFTKDAQELSLRLPELKKEMEQDGMIWVSWPKKVSKIATDVDENLIRDIGLGCGLVDIKVCAIDETWSGLKFVIPVKDRTG